MTNAINAPDAIWLNYGDARGDEIDHNDRHNIGWTECRPFTTISVGYVRDDLHEALQAQLAEAKSENMRITRRSLAANERLEDRLEEFVFREQRLASFDKETAACLFAVSAERDDLKATTEQQAAEIARLRGMVPRWIAPGLPVPEGMTCILSGATADSQETFRLCAVVPALPSPAPVDVPQAGEQEKAKP